LGMGVATRPACLSVAGADSRLRAVPPSGDLL
jgi:hypothetical protein